MFEQVRCILCGNDFSCIVWFVSPFPAFFWLFFPRTPVWTGWIKNPQIWAVITAVCAHASAMRFIRKCVWCRDACTHTWWLFCQLTPFVWGVEMLGSCKSVASHKSEYTVMWSWYLWHVTIEIIPFYIYKIVWIHVIKLKKLLNHGFFIFFFTFWDTSFSTFLISESTTRGRQMNLCKRVGKSVASVQFRAWNVNHFQSTGSSSWFYKVSMTCCQFSALFVK